MGFAPLLLVVVALAPTAQATHESAVLNPIRKVVTLLQSMQTKVEAEGEKEEELFKKFMCYCKTSSGALTDSIAAADYKATSLTSEIKVLSEQQAALKEALPIVKADRAAAKAAMADGTALREKDAAAYAAEKATDDADVAAINKAIAALAKGMAGAFLQTGTAQVLRKIVTSMSNVLEADRQDVLSFLGGAQGSEYAPQSGEIEGILKQMAESMSKGSAEATAEEEAAIKTYEELMAAKKKEVAALTESVETKTAKLGELGVAIVQGKDDMTETEKSAAADKEFAATMKTSCATKEAEWAEIEKTRSEELIALAETIKVLNDDDALELFKKTLPSAASSFLQVGQSMASTKARALSALNEARLHAARPERAHLDLIALALHGKKIGFDKIIEMIDKMVETLKKEQTDDESKKEYCGNQFDMADDKKKGLEQAAGDAEALIESAKEFIVTIKEELAALEAGIKELDKSVAEATQQRKDENVEFKAMMASDSASKELLAFAKNRLNKFYNHKLYKPAPKVELSAEDRIFVSEGGTPPPTVAGGIAGTGIAVLAQVSAHVQLKHKAAPPPPPESFGPYTKKSEENTGVIAMIDLLINDLDKEMAEGATAEKDAQADYEVLMKDSAAKRVADSSALAQKSVTKAALEEDLAGHTEAQEGAKAELAAVLEYIMSLHGECDWLLQYFDVRKGARDSEIDALGKAKAVLNGADYSLVQTKARTMLRRSA